jgi:hypothetical protein
LEALRERIEAYHDRDVLRLADEYELEVAGELPHASGRVHDLREQVRVIKMRLKSCRTSKVEILGRRPELHPQSPS